MNGYTPSSGIVNAEDNFMGGVVEGGVSNADNTSPRKAAIDTVQAELRQKYSVRDETKRELEFLEKGGNLLDYKLPCGASVSVQSTSITYQQKDRLVANEAKGSFAFVASSHGDSVESSGGHGVVPSEANSADNLMLFDAETEFSEGARGLSGPCRSDIVPVEQPFYVTKTQKHGDSAAFAPPRKAYKRRHRSRPSREAASLSSRQGSRDVNGLELEAEKKSTKLVVLPTICPPEGTLVQNETPGGLHHNDFGVLNSIESMKVPAEGVSQSAEPDSVDPCGLMNKQLNEEPLSGAERTPNERGSSGLEGIQAVERKTPSVADSQLVLNQMSAHETNGFNWRQGGSDRKDVQRDSGSQGVGVLKSQLICSTTSQNIDNNNISEMCTKVPNVGSTSSNRDQYIPDGPSVSDIPKSVNAKKDAEKVTALSLVNQETDYGSQNVRENGSLLQSGEDLVQSDSDLKDRLLDQITVEKRDACGELSEPNRKRDYPVIEYPDMHNEITGHQRIDSTYAVKIDEESILKEAQIIEAKRKRIAELSVVSSPAETQQRSQWGYVLEEMIWLSNDFSQERMWKTAVAAQISFQASVAFRLRREKKTSDKDAKIAAHTIAKAVLEFWESAGVQGANENLGQKSLRNQPIRSYAARLTLSHKSNSLFGTTEFPLSPDTTFDQGVPDLSGYSFTYENFFYTVPDGAMETYRKLIMSHVAQIERVGTYVQDEAGMSTCDGTTDLEFQDNPYNEDEGETSTFNMPVAFEHSHSHGYGRKKLKHKHGHGMWPYEASSDLFPMQRSERKNVNQQSGSVAKRSGSCLNASIPTKRVRTASRRIINPFSAGPSGSFQLPNKTDASSGDTSSLQDDQSILRGGLAFPSAFEVESPGAFEKHSPFESAEVSMMPKRKKAKHMNAAYNHRWQIDSGFHEDQREHLKRRPESRLIESNGNSGLFGQPPMKKPKVIREARDNPFDNLLHTGGSVPSPVASQFSNMHSPSKFVKMLGSRDRSGRKVKGLKISAEQQESGSPWSVFEDQALVVLVHDLGPNWELVSDAFNSTLQFKCVFRYAKECKERHYVLMDRTSGDGADSAEDSGSSQPYPTTLPGIPKGSARQLFQRLQGPFEEDTLKSHFEKLIVIGKKHLYRRSQDPKQLQQPHSSHSIALTQIYPNNLSGGPTLTPLDLCDDVVQGPDTVSTGLQGPHTNGAVSNQGTTNPLLLTSSACSSLQGSPNRVSGNSFSSSPGPVNSSARHVVPRCGPLSADEHQKIQHYNQMMPGRNISQASLSGNDRGIRTNSGSGAMGTMSNASRSFPVARPGFQVATSAPMVVNPGSMVAPAVSPNKHAGVGSSHGSPMPRPLIRPEVHMSGNSQGVSHFGGLSAPMPNQTSSPTVSSYALPISPQRQQAYALRLAKERQLQQRLMQQRLMQQQSQPQQPQLPVQTGSPVQPQKSLPVPSLSPIQQHQQKHQASSNVAAGGSVLANHIGKQQSRQQFPQSNQQHPQQQQQLQAQQQVKVVKGAVSGASINPGSLPLEKGESSTQLMKTQGGLYTGSALNTMQSTRPYLAAQSPPTQFPQQKIYSSHRSSASKHIQTSQFDTSSQGHVLPGAVSAVTGSSIKQASSQHKVVNENQSLPQRIVLQNHQIGSSNKAQGRLPDANHHTSSSGAQTVAVSSSQHRHASKPVFNESVLKAGQVTGPRPSAVNLDDTAQRQQQPQIQQPPQSPPIP